MIIQVLTLLLTSLLLHVYTCIDKSMQIILERDFIDRPLTFNIGLLQLIFHTSVFTYYIFMLGVFNPNIPIILPRVCTLVLFIIRMSFSASNNFYYCRYCGCPACVYACS